MTVVRVFNPTSEYRFQQPVRVQPAIHSDAPIQLKQIGLVLNEDSLNSLLNDDGSVVWDMATGTNKSITINKDLDIYVENFNPLMSPFLEITQTGAGGWRVRVFMVGVDSVRHGGGADGNLLDDDITFRALLGMRITANKITYSIDSQIVNQVV